jgi:hypothetical protein
MDVTRGVVYSRSDERDTAWFVSVFELVITTWMIPIEVRVSTEYGDDVSGHLEGFDRGGEAAEIKGGGWWISLSCDDIEALTFPSEKLFDSDD